MGDVGVALQHHHRIAARSGAEHLHGRDIDAPQRQRHGHLGNTAGGVLVVDDEGVAVPAEICRDAVDFRHADTSAAHRCRLERKLPPGAAGQGEHGGVGVGRAQLHRVDAELHPLLRGQRKAVRQTGVVRAQTQQPRHQCTVGAVALAGGGKAAVQADLCLRRNLAQKLLCGITDLCRTGGVAGGRPDHHRAQNIK